MPVKIKVYKGLEITYDERSHMFEASVGEGECYYATNQKELEGKLDKYLNKTTKDIPVLQINENPGTKHISGKLTSSNPDTKEIWVTMENLRRKLSVSSSYQPYLLYEDTVTNQAIAKEIDIKKVDMLRIRNEIDDLIKTLEKPINMEYFGWVKT